MKTEIIQCLRETLVPDSATVQSATQKLSVMSKQMGFCLAAMEIADDQSQNISIRQGALVQLKSVTKKYWNTTQNEISAEEKSAVLGSLVQAFIQSSNVYSLLKLYKDIFSTIIGFTHKHWLPTETLINSLNSNQNPIAILHIIIAIETNFEIAIIEEERIFFYSFLNVILPTLLAFVQRNTHEEVIYLAMKIIWKIVHYEVSHEIRGALCNWMDLILSVVGASNQQLEAKFEDTQDRGTSEFFYFHAKKWATRILYRFLYRHANANGNILASEEVKQLNKDFSKYWYDNFGQKAVDIITKQFMIPTITKVRYFQLKCLIELVKAHPNEMKQFSESFQYHILPEFLKLKPEDEEIANNDPIEWISKEDDYSLNFTYLKKIATEAWISFTNIGAKRKKKGKAEQIGPLFNENMKFLRTKLEGSNPLETEMAMFLICKIRTFIENNDQIRSLIPNLISACIVPHFTSEIMFLRARSMEFFMEYGDLGFDQSIIKKAVEGIYFCLTQDNYPLVRLKAAEAFNVLLHHENARDEVKPLFKQILEIYLVLMEKYESENLIHSLTGIVEHFSVDVGPYACELIKYLSKQFVKLYNKDKTRTNDNDYDGETELAAAGVLNTMRILLESPIEKESISRMEEDILDVADCVFGSGDCDYTSDVLGVLKAYTHRMPAITEKLLLYFIFLIYYVAGINQQFWPLIKDLPLPEISKNNLESIKNGCAVETLTEVMFVLRNYIALDSGLLFKMNDLFGVNLLELLFKMIDQIYQKGPDEFEGEIEMNSSTILMVYLLENNYQKWDEQTIKHIWQVAKFNLLKAKSKVLKSLNSQLLSVLIWNNPSLVIFLAQSENIFEEMINCILSSEPKIREEHQRQRIILGVSELLTLPNKPQELLPKIPSLFKMMIGFVNKNCQCRLDDDYEENYATDSEEEEEELDINDFDGDEPEDMWEEDFESNYSSKLDETDEIKHFKASIQKLQNEEPNIYSQLMATVPADELSNLDQNVTKAIEKYYH